METSLFFQTPKVSAKIRTHHRRTSSQCKIIIKDNDEGILKSEFPTQLICLLENKSSNWDIRFKSGLLGNRESVTGLKSDVISSAKSEYVLVHNDSIAYHHLYMYFANSGVWVIADGEARMRSGSDHCRLFAIFLPF